MADRLLLTKCDLADSVQIDQLAQRLRELNPGAPQVLVRCGEVRPESVLGAGLFSIENKPAEVAAWLLPATIEEEYC